MAKRRTRGSEPTRASAAQRWAVPVAVATSALAPFVQPVGGISPYTFRFAGILVAALAWLWAWLAAPAAFRFSRHLVGAAALVGVVTIASSLASADPGAALTWGAEGSLMGAPTWLALLVVFVMSASAEPSRLSALALRVAFAWAVPAALLVTWEAASSAPQVTGGFGNGNYAGAALVSLVPLALFFSVNEERADVRPYWRYAVLVLMAGVVLSGSLANLIALAVALAVVLVLAPERLMQVEPRTGRRAAAVLAGLLAVALLIGALALFTGVLPRGLDRWVSERVLGATALTRIEMAKIALAVFAEHPLLGVGPDGVQLASQSHLTERLLALESGGYTDYRVLVKDPHSLPLLALASLGVLGATALAWLAALWGRELVVRTREACAKSRSGAFRVALAVGTLAHLTALLFMPWAVSFGPLAPLLAGLAIAGEGPGLSGASEQRPNRGALILGLASTAAALVAAAWLAAAAAYGDTRIALARGQSAPDVARAAYASGARAQPTRAYPAYEALYATGFLASEGLEPLDAYQAAVDRAPQRVLANAGYLANLAQASLDEAYLSGRTDLSWERARIERAARMAPNHPDVVLEQAHLALLTGDIATARRHLARTARFAPDAPRHLLYSYYLALAEGDPARAEGLLPRIERTGPGHARLAKGWER